MEIKHIAKGELVREIERLLESCKSYFLVLFDWKKDFQKVKNQYIINNHKKLESVCFELLYLHKHTIRPDQYKSEEVEGNRMHTHSHRAFKEIWWKNEKQAEEKP